MADKQPQPPTGFQRPGIPGAGNLLDPAVRGELREKVHAAVQDTVQEAPRQDEAVAEPTAAPAVEPAATPAPAAYRAGPFPHGDVDLRGLAANVAHGPVRTHRGRSGRRFYFLPAPTATDASSPPEPTQPPPGPKPG